MPELPNVVVYQDALNRHYAGQVLERVEVKSPFVVRTFEPELIDVEQRRIVGFQRLGKRIVWEFEGDLYIVLHLMIAGRLHRKKSGSRPRAKTDLMAFCFADDTLMFTEASPKKLASIHVVAGRADLATHDPGGLEVLECSVTEFRDRLLAENHTLKRALTDPHAFSGIGNAYSDEIR